MRERQKYVKENDTMSKEVMFKEREVKKKTDKEWIDGYVNTLEAVLVDALEHGMDILYVGDDAEEESGGRG